MKINPAPYGFNQKSSYTADNINPEQPVKGSRPFFFLYLFVFQTYDMFHSLFFLLNVLFSFLRNLLLSYLLFVYRTFLFCFRNMKKNPTEP
ncbi:hypothetical protein B5E64_12890 [Drancourtella sp. An12]|nr:hypothetical protein B5E64_12890 [Drancourtella sp. An12]